MKKLKAAPGAGPHNSYPYPYPYTPKLIPQYPYAPKPVYPYTPMPIPHTPIPLNL